MFFLLHHSATNKNVFPTNINNNTSTAIDILDIGTPYDIEYVINFEKRQFL